MPRVLIPVTFPGGGIRTYMIYNLKPLHKAGFRFTFLSAKGSVFDNFKNDFADSEGTEFVDVSPGTLSAVKAIRKELKTGKYSLVHSQGLQAGTLTEIAKFSLCFLRKTAVKISSIITLHDVIVPQNDIPGKCKWLKKKIIAFFTRRANVIIPVSHDCAENHLAQFPAWKRSPVTVKVITNGIKISGQSASSNHRQTTAFRYPLTAGFFGRFMPQKGFDILLDALLLLDKKGYGDKFKLLATIDRHGYTNETLKRVAKDPILERMVQFVEAVPDITPLLQQIDVCIIPSRWEACPLLPMEVMVCGVPVIGSDAIGLREVLMSSPALQFHLLRDSNRTEKCEQVQTLTDCIIEFINNAEEYKSKSCGFVSDARERFDVRKAAEELLSVYLELIHK